MSELKNIKKFYKSCFLNKRLLKEGQRNVINSLCHK